MCCHRVIAWQPETVNIQTHLFTFSFINSYFHFRLICWMQYEQQLQFLVWLLKILSLSIFWPQHGSKTKMCQVYRFVQVTVVAWTWFYSKIFLNIFWVLRVDDKLWLVHVFRRNPYSIVQIKEIGNKACLSRLWDSSTKLINNKETPALNHLNFWTMF